MTVGTALTIGCWEHGPSPGPMASMPEVLLTLHWPDGLTSQLYSPSTVILDHLPPGEQLSVAELLAESMRRIAEEDSVSELFME